MSSEWWRNESKKATTINFKDMQEIRELCSWSTYAESVTKLK